MYREVLCPISACAGQDCEGKVLLINGETGQGGGSVAMPVCSSSYLRLPSPVAHSGTFGQRSCWGKFLGNWEKWRFLGKQGGEADSCASSGRLGTCDALLRAAECQAQSLPSGPVIKASLETQIRGKLEHVIRKCVC